jgi:replicative DNA helicase
MTAIINPAPDANTPVSVPALLPHYLEFLANAKDGYPTGIPSWDKTLNGLQPGIHILGAKPNIGKTTLALQVCLHGARRGLPSVFLSYDEPRLRLAGKLVAMAAKTPQSALRRPEAASLLERAAEDHHEAISRVCLLDGSAEACHAVAGKTLRENIDVLGTNTGLLVIDYLQLMATRRNDMGDFRVAVSRTMNEIKDVASAYQIPVLVIAALNRDGYERADFTSLRESSDIEYTADTGTFLVEDSDAVTSGMRKALTMTVGKNRFGERGREIFLRFDGETGVIGEVDTF